MKLTLKNGAEITPGQTRVTWVEYYGDRRTIKWGTAVSLEGYDRIGIKEDDGTEHIVSEDFVYTCADSLLSELAIEIEELMHPKQKGSGDEPQATTCAAE